ncbi:MAG: C4-dicarboxylate-binding periplasmic protein DctP [Alphaproteobacteria bacterium UBA4588]|nr:MAG: C4-dicarboxylate-binding periplasmic protein DctP [Alphaproteobacteria bacterium UBA4588]
MWKYLSNGIIRPVSLIAALIVVVTSFQANAEQIIARMSGHWSPTHQSSIHAQMFADEVTKRSDGRLKIEYYPSKQLFGIREVLGAITSGAVELGGVVGVVSFPPINKNFNVASYPGLFSSYEQQRGFFKDSAKGQAIWNDITAKSKSQLIMYNPVGPVMTFSSARELTGIDVMKGLKARRLLKSELPMWKALEANAVSLPTGEVYTSLQTGMIDTINSPPGSIEAYSWWEFLSYGQKPYQYFADAYIMANKDWMSSLPEDLRNLVLTVGAEVGSISTNTILNAGEQTLTKFVERGGKITELSGDEKAKFDKLMQEKVMPAMADMFDKDTLSEAQNYASK